jgi:hypothetical protein
MARVSLCFLMAATSKENIKITISREKGFTAGPMVKSIKASGSKIKCTERAPSNGAMDVST